MGGLTLQNSLMENFRESLDVCGLKDLGFSGPRYTWTNRRDPPHTILERLDRCVSNVG